MIWLTLSLFSAWASAETRPLPDIEMARESLPGGVLTLDLVVTRAIQTSDSFRALDAQADAAIAPELRAGAPFDLRPYASVGRTDDRREPFSPFMPSRVASTQYKLGVSQFFGTGTNVGVELEHSKGTIGFLSASDTNYFQTVGSLFVEQSLWRDFLGGGTRAKRLAGKANTEALGFDTQEKMENWALSLIKLYYDAWFALAELKAEDERLLRQERLIGWTEILVRRGNSERPDLLQVQSALSQAKIERARVEQKLGDRWRELVTALKLPKEWLLIDVRKIPLALDEREKSAEEACKSYPLMPPQPSRKLELAQAQMRAAQAEEKRASAYYAPDLKLKGELGSNGIDTASRGVTFQETVKASHPQWGVSLQFSMPVQFSEEKADLIQSRAQQVAAEASAAIALDEQNTDWLNSCSDLKRSRGSYLWAKEASEQQIERARLEAERFRLGRSGVFQVIQAEDDSARAVVQRDAAAVESRVIAWKVLRLSGSLNSWIQSLRGRP